MTNQQTKNLGRIPNGVATSFSYSVQNTADTVMKITSLGVGCSACTTASTDKSELQPGESTTINVVFTPKSTGVQKKSVTVYSEGRHSFDLIFTAEVY